MQTNEHKGDAIYALGHSEEERQRLIEQDAFLGGFTERLFLDAGIGPGMRVLDVGCGVGDVSLRAASLVGPEGMVVGVDKDPLALEHARERVFASGLTNVSLVEGDIRERAFDEPFDAAVGRFVLKFVADPVEVLRYIAGHVRPGGIFAFQEWTAAEPVLSFPHAPLWERTFNLLVEIFRRAGTEMEMGLKLYSAFVMAGLPTPSMRAERPVGGGPDYPGYQWLAAMVRSVLPMMEQLGVATTREMDIETLSERLRDEVVGLDGVIAFPSITGAWARKPVEQGNQARRPGSASIQRSTAATEWATQNGGKSASEN
jgi:ubiquinone/menaquinone biosynthesis C-methylase UbiE